MADQNLGGHLIALSEESTGHAIIQVNTKGQNCILLHRGANAEITDEYLDSVLEGFGKGDLLVLQNEVNMIGDIIDRAFEKGLEIAFNPSPMDDMIPKYHLEKITWFLLNEIEGNQITGETDPEKITDKMLAMYPRARVVLTLGKEGGHHGGGRHVYRLFPDLRDQRFFYSGSASARLHRVFHSGVQKRSRHLHSHHGRGKAEQNPAVSAVITFPEGCSSLTRTLRGGTPEVDKETP